MKIKELVINDFQGNGEMLEIPCSRLYTNGQPIYVCRDTGLVRAKNLRTAEEIAQAWSEEVYSSEFGRETYTARIPAVKARQTYVADFANINFGLRDKYVCDIGAGEGQFLEIISSSEYQARVFGIEPSEKNCENLKRKNFPCFQGTIEGYVENSQFTDQSFDVVTIMWTLVNSYSCLDMVAAAYQMLKPGGYIVVAEGSRILVPFKKPLHYYFSKLQVDLHPYHFSTNALQNLLKVVGFDIVAVNRYIDSDYLCIIGRKTNESGNCHLQVDNYIEVLSFFERWHVDTQMYYTNS